MDAAHLSFSDSLYILIIGVISLLFALAPVFMVVGKEISLLTNKDQEGGVMQSSFRVLFIGVIFLALFSIIYSVLIYFLDFMLPNNLSKDGLKIFWDISERTEEYLKIYKGSKIISMINAIAIIAFIAKKFIISFVPLIITYMSFKIVLEGYNSINKDESYSIFVFFIIVVIGIVFTKTLLNYYSSAVSWMVFHPVIDTNDPNISYDSEYQSLLYLGQKWWLEALFK